MSRKFRVAVCGATGAVGNQMLTCLEESDFPLSELRLLASERSKGKRLMYQGREHEVQVLGNDSFQDIDVALFLGRQRGEQGDGSGGRGQPARWWWTTPRPGAWTQRCPWWCPRSTPTI
jgi:hypothetical protein